MRRRPANGRPTPANARRAWRCAERLADADRWRIFLELEAEAERDDGDPGEPRGWIP